MQFTPEEQLTIDAYNRHAAAWHASHGDVKFWPKEKTFDLFQSYLPSGKIVELGCGGGRDAAELITRGYDYVGTDVAPGLVELARHNIPDHRFEVMSLYDPVFPPNSFDGFWCFATLLHVPRERLSQALKTISYIVRSDGIGFITMKKGSGEKMDLGMVDDRDTVSRYFVYYQPDEFRDKLEESGLTVVDYFEAASSPKTTWLAYLVRVRKQ